MKNIFFITCTLLLSITNGFSQDIITKKDGTKIEVKVLEISSTEVKYYNFTQPNGPLRILGTYEITEINYENGESEKFNAKEPIVTGNNRPETTEKQGPTPKYSKLDMMGAGFAIDVLVGASQFSAYQYNYYYYDPNNPYIQPQPLKRVDNSFSLGFRISNKFYFDATPKWRTGIQVSYVRLNMRMSDAIDPFQSFSISPMHFGTANIIRLNDNLGLEANFLFGLTLSVDNYFGNGYTGFTFNPEVKLRYKVLAVGLDYSRTGQMPGEQYHRLHQLSLSIGAKF